MSSRWKRYLARSVAVALGVLLPLAAVEIGYRLTRKPPGPPPQPGTVYCDPCPYLFELNPRRPDVSSQKLRDRVFPLVPEAGMRRILVVGDSIPFGVHVAPQQSFPKALERHLGGEAAHVEVVNGGVIAYSAFNERAYYAHRLRDFHPQLVVVSFCMNDVVDPSLHWAKLVGARRELDDLPPDAIPNPAYHEGHALPLLHRRGAEQGSFLRRLLGRSELYRRAVAPLLAPGMPDTTVTADGRKYPAYLSGEDTLGMDVLMDWGSTEWVWLRRQYDEMLADLRRDGARVVILVNPLAYQLEEGYPLFPQRLFERYCAERRVPCFDVLPALREHGGARLFFGSYDRLIDVWHYTAEGHEVVGAALGDFLLREGLLGDAPPAPPR